jgi:hypothetical protein
VAELGNRRAELVDELATGEPDMPSKEELADLRGKVRQAIETGPSSATKVLLQALIHEIRVEARDAIRPVFKLPVGSALLAGVRAPSRLVRPQGFEP